MTDNREWKTGEPDRRQAEAARRSSDRGDRRKPAHTLDEPPRKVPSPS